MDNQSEVKLVELIQTQPIASLGTQGKDGLMVSMVLYVAAPDFSEYYIHISQLAKHTRNIMEDDQVGLMICETAVPGADVQVLARLSIMGQARKIETTDARYAPIKSRYLQKYPSATMRFQLADFSLYAIEPKSARYVAGFGKTFNLTKKSLIRANSPEN